MFDQDEEQVREGHIVYYLTKLVINSDDKVSASDDEAVASEDAATRVEVEKIWEITLVLCHDRTPIRTD